MHIKDIVVEQSITEIERLTRSDFVGGKHYLQPGSGAKRFIPLPGGSGLLYTIETPSHPRIKLWDTTGRNSSPKVIASLSLEKPYGFPLKGALQVDTITVDEDYRGYGLAKALYGIVLTIMKRPLIAGWGQTPGGRRNWVSLSQIPGVEVKGYVKIKSEDLTTVNQSPSHIKKAEKKIDIIMSKLGGEHMGTVYAGTPRYPIVDEYFAFDVRPNATGSELKAAITQSLAKVYYGETVDVQTGLYAIWTGQ